MNVSVSDLLDEPRVSDLRKKLILSEAAPIRYVGWCQEKQIFTVMDLAGGKIVRTRIAVIETLAEAQAAAAELQAAVH